jgi:predicted hydrocarbon binding protein
MDLDPDTIKEAREDEFKRLTKNENMEGDLEGRVELAGERFNIMGSDYFMAEIYESLSDLYGSGAGGILFNTGIEYGNDLLKLIKNAESPQEHFGRFLGLLKFLGYSTPRIEDGRLVVPSSPTAESHLQTDHEKTKVCYFLAGILTGAAQETLDDAINIRENYCKAEGDTKCIFNET